MTDVLLLSSICVTPAPF